MEANLDGATTEGAAARIEGLLESFDQPEPQPVEEAKAPEPQEIEEEVQETVQEEAEEVKAESEETETVEDQNSDDDDWQLPNRLNDLAEQLGVEADDLLNLHLNAKVNGQDQEVTLKDLKSSHMMEADYRHKTSELAEQRRAFEEEAQTKQSQWNDRVTQLDAMTGALENQLMAEYQGTDWNSLRVEDPAEFAARQQEFNARAMQIEQVKQNATNQIQQSQMEQQQKQQEEYAKYLQKQNELLSEKMPEWADLEKRKELTSNISTYLKNQSFTDQELSGLVDHRHLMLIQKAMAYDKLTDSKPAIKKKIAKAPKLVKPGAKQTKSEVRDMERGSLRKRLKKSGSQKDAANLFKSFM